MTPIFVFGSNESGVHGAGAALYAEKYFGAKRGIGFGFVGNSFAIPTKDWDIQTLPISTIKHYVNGFIRFSYRTDRVFHLSKIGCGLAGYTENEIAPLFKLAPDNVLLISDSGEIICRANEWFEKC